MAPSHESLFSYSITKPYPYQWFTPVVGIGFLAAAAIFSFLNFASNAYIMVVETTSDPNATVSSGLWYNTLPSYFKQNVQASCQSANLAVGSQVFTNQTALTYTITGVWQGDEGSDSLRVLPALTYINNPLEQCVVASVDVDLEALDRTPIQIAYSEWGATVRPFITCLVQGSTGPTYFNLTTNYDLVPVDSKFSEIGGYTLAEFLTRNATSRASLYWGESLLSMYWAYTSKSMENYAKALLSADDPPIRKGTMSFSHDGLMATAMSDPDFFQVDYQFILDAGDGWWDHITPPTNVSGVRSAAFLYSVNATPPIFLPSDTLAKAMHATVMTDLGQVSEEPNLLTDPDELQFFTANFSVAAKHIANAFPGPETQDYASAKGTTGPLGITPSVFSTTYLCQVPQMKSAGDIFLAVLIADLVFMQALWKLFTFITSWWLLRTRANANVCEGCANRMGYGLEPLGTPRSFRETHQASQEPLNGESTPVDGLYSVKQRNVREQLLYSP